VLFVKHHQIHMHTEVTIYMSDFSSLFQPKFCLSSDIKQALTDCKHLDNTFIKINRTLLSFCSAVEAAGWVRTVLHEDHSCCADHAQHFIQNDDVCQNF